MRFSFKFSPQKKFNRQAQLIKFFPIITKTGLAIRAHQGHLFETKEKGLVILLPTETNEK